MEDVGTEYNPYTDASPITGRKFTRQGVIEAGEQFANYERHESLHAGNADDRRAARHRADILWALIQLIRELS